MRAREVSPATTWLGIDVVSANGGEAVLTMATRPEMTNRQDVVHGGFIAALADTAMGWALSSTLPDGERHYSFDLKLSFIATGRIGEGLRAIAKVLHSGHRTGVAECRVEGDDGRLVATGTASFFIRQPFGNND
ncbi:MAG: PaaI family thioesterase [Candidatus Dormibacteraeota bacterium]|nr:PaaI family thioesterase [Candidatus Dormibacteraeota bacterium]